MEDIIEPEKADQELVIPEDEEIIELTDTIESPAESEEETIELTDMIEDSAESEDEIVELTDIAETPDLEPVEPIEKIDEKDDIIEASPTVTSEQVDAAIERVVRDMLSEKIESILVQVIEKEVSKEIARLKGLLMDEPVNGE